jgi:hypothetical protein
VIVQAKSKSFVPCPSCCMCSSFRVDHLPVSQTITYVWTCNECHQRVSIKRVSENDFEALAMGVKETPVTVTLRSITTPPITLKLNTWKYAHSQGLSQEEYESDKRYFYNEHTCPTNWIREVEEIEFEGDRDPHGVFEFVSVEDGHYESE